jgi:hypothetical protein
LILGFLVAHFVSGGDHASCRLAGYNPPIAPEVLHQMSRQQRWLPRTIVNPAPSQRQTEAQLVMDRLVRVGTACWRRVSLRQGVWNSTTE